jgi:hypothetical protein
MGVLPRFDAPTNPHPPVEVLKINRPGEHEKAGGDEFVTLPDGASEPPAGDHSGALSADVVPPLRGLAEIIDERLQLGPLCPE